MVSGDAGANITRPDRAGSQAASVVQRVAAPTCRSDGHATVWPANAVADRHTEMLTWGPVTAIESAGRVVSRIVTAGPSQGAQSAIA